MNQEIGTLHVHLHEEREEKEEIHADLDMAMSLRESITKKNEVLTKELVDANELLAKFNKSIAMLDEQIQSQRQNKDTHGLGYTTFEQGEPSNTKVTMHEAKSAPKTKKNTG